jgi:hypothetical protein
MQRALEAVGMARRGEGGLLIEKVYNELQSTGLIDVQYFTVIHTLLIEKAYNELQSTGLIDVQ